MSTLLVLDFDGTITDAELEGAPFRGGYLEDVATLVDAPLDEVFALAEGFEAEIAADPQAHGWVFNGEIVAPATVDPYLRIMPVARKIFDRFGVLRDEAMRNRVLDGLLYKYNYQKTKTAFKPGAKAALSKLEGAAVRVVTNSHTEAVAQKIETLGREADGSNALAWLTAHVYGRARKYMVDDTFDQVPRDLTLPGLSRPVKLRRRHYFEVLERLRVEVGASWAQVVVCGDIFELDLSLPLAMGARVGLVTNPFTPAYERAFVERHERGRLIGDLSELEALIR